MTDPTIKRTLERIETGWLPDFLNEEQRPEGWLGRQLDAAQAEADVAPSWMYPSNEPATVACPACDGALTNVKCKKVCTGCGTIVEGCCE